MHDGTTKPMDPVFSGTSVSKPMLFAPHAICSTVPKLLLFPGQIAEACLMRHFANRANVLLIAKLEALSAPRTK